MRWPARAIMLVACVSSVDLPMPGSPPTSSTEPRTKPPPVTRSSSVMPEDRRGASWVFPDRLSSANVRPLRLERIETGTLPVVSSSASVFHSPQDLALALPAVIGRAAVLADEGKRVLGHGDSESGFSGLLIARNGGRDGDRRHPH